MARDKDMSRGAGSDALSNQSADSAVPASSAPNADRERNIETTRDQSRSKLPGRPYSATIRSGSTSPFSVMRRMAEDMDRLFDHFGLGRGTVGLPTPLSLGDDDLWSMPALSQNASWSPQVEVFERGDKLVVRADLPGLRKDDVNVEVEDGVLSISGERKDEHEEKRDGFYRSERSYGQFYRAIPLPDGVSAEQCDASFKDGVLEVTLNAPKLETKKARKIAVK